MDISALNKPPDLPKPPERVVSLVPSITESLFVLGFGQSVVGITDYCIYPAGQLEKCNRVRGPKNPDIEKIIELLPDVVILNQEENTKQTAEALIKVGIPVWVTIPKTVDQAIDVLRGILALFHTDAPAMQINSLQAAVDWARSAALEQDKIRYFCPIWQGEFEREPWWMTFNRHTYADNLLELFGGENIFSGRERRYPLSADL
ncbi:MAG: helical backbone metal receptor, partial [Anaerolineae bacterium]|nr:helical backbone metal receptor [Anaerolineae bacterium]